MESRPLERTAGTDAAVLRRRSWTRRVLIGGIGTAGASVALAAFAATGAFANAPNPVTATATSSSPDAQGHVTVTVSGQWSWEAPFSPTPQTNCDGRYGAGWAIDWWGINGPGTSIPGLSYPVVATNGNTIATQGGQPFLTTSTAPSPAVTLTAKSGTTFHASQTLNGFQTPLCTNGHPAGTFSSTATYPDAASVPSKICVNFYDLHGSPGSPKLNDFFSTNGDNSIRTNAFDPATVGGNCFVVVPQHPTINVDKTNDAGGSFQKSGRASSLGQDVNFQVQVTNTSTVPVIVDSVGDAITQGTGNVGAVTCLSGGSNLVGQTIQPSATATCTFKVSDYLNQHLAAGDDRVIDQVDVGVHSSNGNTGSGFSRSTVLTPLKAELAAHIQLCSGGAEVANGNLHVTGPTSLPDDDQIAPTPVDAGSYTVDATAPAGFHLVACGNDYHGETSLTSTIAPGGSHTFRFFVAPNGAPNVEVAKTGPATGIAGGQGVYTVKLTNSGNATATSPIQFIDVLPVGESFVSASGTDMSCSAAGQTVNCTYSHDLASAASASVSITISYAANTAGQTLTDCASLNSQSPTSCVDTVINQPNLVIAKTGPATGTAGGQGTYKITVTNNGNGPAPSATFVDQLPAGETFVSATGATCAPAAGNAQNINCTLPGTLAANGGSATVTVVVSYGSNTAGQTLTDCAVLPNNQQDCVDTHIGQPKLVIAKKGPATGVPGGRGTYTITVTNTGDGPANNVSFVDALPAGETFVSATGGVCTAAGSPQQITCSVPGTLAANGGSASVDVVVSYDQNTGGQTLTDCASLPGSQACADTHINTPDVRILKTGPATGTAGGNGTYTITVSNVGQAPANNVTFVDQLPVGETFVSATGNGVSCAVSAANAQLVNCSLAGPLAAGGSASVQVTVAYGANTGGQTLTDCAKLDVSNQSCVDTKIPGHPVLTVVKTNDANADGIFHDTETANAPGDSVTFTAVVTNTSNVAVVIDSVTDAYGATTQNTCAQLVGTLLAPGQSMTCVFTIDNYAPAAGSSLTDTVTFTGHENGNPGNTTTGADTSTVTTKTPGAPDLAILKTASAAGVKAGDTLVYGLTVSNVGAGPTTDAITVTDSVPAGLSIVSVDGGTAWNCTVSGQNITCTYLDGALVPGATAAQITVTTLVNSNAAGTLVNTGVVTTRGDTNPFNDRSTVKTPVTAVLPEVIKKPPTPTVTTPPTVLPFTGSNAGAMVPVGLLMVLGGLMFLVVGRRRRHSA